MRAKECEREWTRDRKRENERERERKREKERESRNIEEEIERAGCVWYSDWRCERGKRTIACETRHGDASSPRWEQEKDGNTRARKLEEESGRLFSDTRKFCTKYKSHSHRRLRGHPTYCFARISFAVLGFPFSVYICTIETFYVVTRNCTFLT